MARFFIDIWLERLEEPQVVIGAQEHNKLTEVSRSVVYDLSECGW
jgi:hypothetical protein